MFANTGSKRLVTKFQRIAVVVLTLILLIGSLPVSQAQAGNSYFKGSVVCKEGHYNYTFGASGEYYNQWVAFRFFEYQVQKNGAEVYTKVVPASGYKQMQVKTVSDYLSSFADLTISAQNG